MVNSHTASVARPDHTRSSDRHTTKLSRCNRGLDEILPFLHQIQKIVTEECSKHKSAETIPWYKTWESWNQQNLLLKKSMNSVTSIIVPDLIYKERTIKAVVEKCIKEISPIAAYIEITHLTDKSVTWVPRIDIDSFQSVKKKRHRQHNTRAPQNRVDKHSRNSTISSVSPPVLTPPPMPTTINLDHTLDADSVSLTASTLAAIAEIEETTQKGKLILDTAIASKTTAILDLQQDYDSILVDWDNTKHELDKETRLAIIEMNTAKNESR